MRSAVAGAIEDQVGPLGQFDMAHGGLGGRVEQVEVHRVAGQRLQGQRGDELAAAAGHDHAHFGALVAQAADQLGALVGGDAAADAQDDAFPIQPLHRPAFNNVVWIAARRRHLPRPVTAAKKAGLR